MIWVEKDALIGVIEQAANRYDTPCFSCRGYVSASEMWIAGQRIIEKNQVGRRCVVFHLGDHDPSGLDMTRDNQAMLNLFGADVSIIRLALNMPQVQQYNLPPNPAKLSDTRSKDYIAQHGAHSWELDALEPLILDALVSSNIENYLNAVQYNSMIDKQEKERAQILEFVF